MIDVGHGVLPQLRRRDKGAEQARDGAHVAMRQLVPGLGEGVGELGRVLVEPLRDRRVDRIHPQGEVRREHHRGVLFGRIVSVRHGVFALAVLRPPLVRTALTLVQLPVVAEQVVEEAVVPFHGVAGPRTLEAAGDRVGPFAGAERVLPAEPEFFDAGPFGFVTDVLGRVGRAVGLAEGVSAGDQGDSLLVVHRHAGKRFANVLGGGEGIGFAVGPLGIHVDQPHLHGAERSGEFAVAGIAFVAQPGALGPPVDVRLGFPDVLAPAGVAECLETHRLEGAGAGENHQVSPGDFLAVLLLDRPEQAAGLIEARVVGPAVERGEAKRARGRAAPAVGDAVSARAVPGHANEERAVMPIVGRPPGLRLGHDGEDVLLHGVEVEFLEFGSVVELLARGVRQGGVLVEDLQIQLIRPPVAIRPGHRSLSLLRLGLKFGRHYCLHSLVCIFSRRSCLQVTRIRNACKVARRHRRGPRWGGGSPRSIPGRLGRQWRIKSRWDKVSRNEQSGEACHVARVPYPAGSARCGSH